MERRNIDMRALERTEDENFDITAEIQSKLDKLTVNDLPYPQEIIKVSNAITSNTDTAGEIKVGPEGKLLQEFLQFDGLTKQIIDAFDYWLEVILARRIVTTVIPFALGKITFSNVVIKPPQYMDTEAGEERRMFPLYARRNKVTYAVSVYVNIAFYAKDNTSDKPNQSDDVKIAEIPVMLGSKYCNLRGLNEKQLLSIGECALDPYGYFIIEGQEKIVLQHDKLRFNKPFIFPKENKNRNKETGIFEEYVNLNSKKQEFSSFICRFTAMPNLDSERFSEQKEFLPTIQYDAKKSTVVNMLFDKKGKTIVIQLDRFIPDTYLNIFGIYELYGVNFENSESGLLKPILMIINYIKEENQSQIITFLNRAFVIYRNERTTLIDSLKKVMKLPQEIENDTPERQIKFYQERIGEVLFKQTEGVIYADDKQRKYDAKLQMLSIMVARFAEYNMNLRSLDDRDSWSNKRIVSAGPAIEHLFNQIWNFLVVESMIKGSLINVTINEPNFILNNTINKIPGSFVKDNFVRSFGPNTWGVQQSIMKENMTDFLKNETLLAKYSQILRISPETSDKGKQTAIREVHPTQLGYICPIETPEGKQCGIVKSLAVGCYVSIGRDEGLIYNFIVSSNLLYLDQSSVYNTALILNGKFIGWCDGSQTQIVLRDARRRESIYRDTLIYFEKPRTLWIYCDGGRPTRPLLIVDQKTGRLVIEMKNMWNSSFSELLREGCVEYIDALEQEECVVAQSIWDPVFKLIETKNMGSMLAEKYRNPTAQRDPTLFDSFREIITDPNYTHCEMDPNAILSLVASIIPMPDRSQAPRNTYQTSMGKQALSIQNTNSINRFDVEVKSLAYPSRAIFETQMYKYIGLDQLPIGETVMVAMMSYLGYNQEDAIIINQESVDLGLFRIVRTLTYKTIQISDKDFTEVIQRPKKAKNMDMLDKDGVILPGSFVRPDDCLIGKVKKYHGTNEVVDASVYVGMGDTGIVERVLKTTSSDSRRIVLVKIREVRKPLAGDKLASRYAQKGTIGIVLPKADMPQINTGPNAGMTPDLIINQHSIPSRMTIGKMIEIMTSKVAAMKGEKINATAFRPFDLDEYSNSLASFGFDRYGKETMINGMLGHEFNTKIFVGPCYYQALKHHVVNKIQQRARGAIKATTRQPTAGRTKGGGIRLGEMERDALISHGATSCQKEKTFDHSDPFKTLFCVNCGKIADVKKNNLGNVCGSCNQAKYGLVSIPYSTKVLLHELGAASITINFKLAEKKKTGFTKK